MTVNFVGVHKKAPNQWARGLRYTVSIFKQTTYIRTGPNAPGSTWLFLRVLYKQYMALCF